MHRTAIASRTVLVVLLSVVAVTIASQANAQPISETGGRVFGLVGGSFGNGGSAVMISGGAGLRVTRSLGVDFELLHVNDLDLSDSDVLLQQSERLSIFPPVDIKHEGNVTAFLTKMTVEFPVANDRLIPFVTGGGGVGRLSERFSFEFPDRPVLARPAIDARLIRPFGEISRPETGLVVTVGGGLDVRLWRGLAVGRCALAPFARQPRRTRFLPYCCPCQLSLLAGCICLIEVRLWPDRRRVSTAV